MAEKLKVGDKVIYPAHGAGVVEAIEQKVLSGNEQTVYVMKMLHKGMTIMVPLGNVDSVGIRSPVSPKEIDRVYEVLKDNDLPSTEPVETWNRRYRHYKEKINTGSILEIAGVLRSLHQRGKRGALSLGEKRLVDTAMDLLVGEVSCAKKMKEERIRREIELLLEEA
jgi:CarD family transcriptional regulator